MGQATVRETILELQRRSLAWDRDQEDIKGGWKLFYAIDTDIVRMMLVPGNNLQYGTVFSGPDSAETKLCLSYLLSDFLFTADDTLRQREVPPKTYLTVPPHDLEIRNVILQFASHATLRAPTKVERDEIAALIELLRRRRSNSTDDSDDKFAAELRAQAPTLAQLYTNSVGIVDRFKVLRYKLQNIWNAKVYNELLINETEAEIEKHIDSRRAKWYDLILAERLGAPAKSSRADERDESAWAKQHSTRSDAQVLATIDYLNTKLADRKIRVLLVTGTPAIIAAGKKYCLGDQNDSAQNETFRDRYLRHHHWVMSNSKFFGLVKREIDSTLESSIDSAASLERWLKIVSPQNSSQHGKIFTDAVTEVEQKDVPALWEDVVKSLTAAKYYTKTAGLSNSGMNADMKLVGELRTLLECEELGPGTITNIFERAVTASFSKLYLDYGWISLIQRKRNPDFPARKMPALFFDRPYDEVNRYYAKAVELFLPGESREFSEEELEEVKLLSKAASDRDDSLYHSHIIHAAIHAELGVWEPALNLCDMALKIAEGLVAKMPGDNELRRGREAAYLAAIIKRRTAEGSDDLKEAEQYLERAESADIQRWLTLRHRSERITIETRDIYFSFFPLIVESQADSGTPDVFVEVKSAVRGKIDEISALLASNDALLVDLSNGRGDFKDAEPWRIDATEKMIQWIKRQSYTNLFDLSLILFYLDDMSILERSSELDRFNSVIGSEDEQQDPHAWLVCMISDLVISHGRRSIKSDEQTVAFVRRKIADFIAASRYDHGRKTMFSTIVDRSSR
jgi:hypothetical protein